MLGVTNIYAIFLAYIKEKLASLITLTRSMCGRRAENTRHMGIISLIKTNISFTDASSLYFDETSNIFLTRRTSIRKLPNSREGISDRVTRDGDNETKYEEGGGGELHEYSSGRVPFRKTWNDFRERFVSSEEIWKEKKSRIASYYFWDQVYGDLGIGDKDEEC